MASKLLREDVNGVVEVGRFIDYPTAIRAAVRETRVIDVSFHADVVPSVTFSADVTGVDGALRVETLNLVYNTRTLIVTYLVVPV